MGASGSKTVKCPHCKQNVAKYRGSVRLNPDELEHWTSLIRYAVQSRTETTDISHYTFMSCVECIGVEDTPSLKYYPHGWTEPAGTKVYGPYEDVRAGSRQA